MPVRMVLVHHFADDAGALARGASGSQPHLLHGVENAAMHLFQSVANVRQSTADNHRQRIVEIRSLHLVFNVDGLHVEGARRLSVASRRSQGKLRILIVSHEVQFSVRSRPLSVKAPMSLCGDWATRPSKRTKAPPALSHHKPAYVVDSPGAYSD